LVLTHFVRILRSHLFSVTATSPILFHTLSLHDALPIYLSLTPGETLYTGTHDECVKLHNALQDGSMTVEQVKAQAQAEKLNCHTDRKSTRLNSSHVSI